MRAVLEYRRGLPWLPTIELHFCCICWDSRMRREVGRTATPMVPTLQRATTSGRRREAKDAGSATATANEGSCVKVHCRMS